MPTNDPTPTAPPRRAPLTKDERDELREETETANAAFHARGVWCNDYETLLALLDQVEALEEDKKRLDYVLGETNIMPDAYDPTDSLFDREDIDKAMGK